MWPSKCSVPTKAAWDRVVPVLISPNASDAWTRADAGALTDRTIKLRRLFRDPRLFGGGKQTRVEISDWRSDEPKKVRFSNSG